MKYIVVEIQKMTDGNIAVLTNNFDSLREAESKYHNILTYAAVSTLPMHGATLLREDGISLMHKAYYLNVTEEPAEEPLANLSEVGGE